MHDHGKAYRSIFLNTNKGRIRMAIVGAVIFVGVVAELLYPFWK